MSWHVQVSTGVTLRENNLKELKGGKVMDSQGVLVANRRALKERAGLLEIAHELIERFEVGLMSEATCHTYPGMALAACDHIAVISLHLRGV